MVVAAMLHNLPCNGTGQAITNSIVLTECSQCQAATLMTPCFLWKSGHGNQQHQRCDDKLHAQRAWGSELADKRTPSFAKAIVAAYNTEGALSRR